MVSWCSPYRRLLYCCLTYTGVAYPTSENDVSRADTLRDFTSEECLTIAPYRTVWVVCNFNFIGSTLVALANVERVPARFYGTVGQTPDQVWA